MTEENNSKYKKLEEKVEKLERENRWYRNNQRYGLVWEEPKDNDENKEDNKNKRINKVAFPLVEELTEKIIENDGNNHILIEGDNYHSLKSLLYTHKGMVDVIYIDPPYNTKNEGFIYNDKLVDDNDSFKHSKWLTFMNERLRLAKELLSDDGVIFVSIDDNEQAQLKLLMDQIFNEENFVSNIVWKSKSGGGNDSSLIVNENEYILVFAKNKPLLRFNKKEAENNKEKYTGGEDSRGKYYLEKLDRSSLGYSPSLDFPIKLNGKKAIPGGTIKRNKEKVWRWRWAKDTVEWGIKEDLIVLKNNNNGVTNAYNKVYKDFQIYPKEKLIKRVSQKNTPYRNNIDFTNTKAGGSELMQIFGKTVFSYPKPVDLISFLINLFHKKDALVLDFFAGSGTTGHATLKLNNEDQGNRRFILCTNNENNICEKITYKRLKKVINGYRTQNGKDVEGLPGTLRYFKTREFGNIETPSSSDVNKIIDLAEDLLKIKHTTFNLVKKNKRFSIYQNENEVLCYLKDIFSYDSVCDLLLNNKNKKYIYIVSKDDSTYSDAKKAIESSLNNVSFKNIPSDILSFFRQHSGGGSDEQQNDE